MGKQEARRPAKKWLMILGALAASALVIVALKGFGDPVETARRETRERADALAGLVQSTWNARRLSPAYPAVPAELAVWIGDESEFGRDPALEQESGSRLFSVLLDAALAAAASGDLDGARERAENALERVPEDARAAEAHLALARWAAARGDRVGVERHRAAILNDAAPRFVRGTSAALLACLVEPVDTTRALGLLASGDPHLPSPKDSVRVEPDGRVVFVEDPLWRVVRERLIGAGAGDGGASDGQVAFQLRGRAAEAVRTFLRGQVSATDDRWTLWSRERALFAARAIPGQGGVRIVAVTPEGLVSGLRATPAEEPDRPFVVRFDHEPELAPALGFERVDGGARHWLDGTSIGFTIHRQDPLRAGRAEAARQRALRAGLVLLALGILTATFLAVRAMDRADRLNRLRSTFVASVSHDLRTPIQSILLMAETLERGRVAAEKSKVRYFASIRQEAWRLRRFVEDILDGARIERGDGARIERREVDVAHFLEDLERAMRERADQSHAELTFVQHALPEVLEIDPDGVYRAVWNLFENALRYGRSGDAPARVTIEATLEDSVLAFTVRDEGPGVPARFADSVFEPFERGASEARAGASTGTGLGLSIVRALTRAHGGDATLLPSAIGARFVATFNTHSKEDHQGGAA